MRVEISDVLNVYVLTVIHEADFYVACGKFAAYSTALWHFSEQKRIIFYSSFYYRAASYKAILQSKKFEG